MWLAGNLVSCLYRLRGERQQGLEKYEQQEEAFEAKEEATLKSFFVAF